MKTFKNPLETINEMLNSIPKTTESVLVNKKGEIFTLEEMAGKSLDGFKVEQRTPEVAKERVLNEFFENGNVTVKQYKEFRSTVLSLCSLVETGLRNNYKSILKKEGKLLFS